jgi:putative ABC transport system permease protein
VEQLLQDLRYGFRTLVRQPVFATTAILALALGIGANTAVFSVVYAALLKPLPFPQPDQLIYAHDTFPAVPSASVSWPKFLALRDGNRTLAVLSAIGRGSLSLTDAGEPEQVVASRVSGDFFTVLGVGPQLGRLLNREDDVPNGGRVIALSYALWQRRFSGDPAIVGRAVTVDGQPFTVAGVMPPSFNYPAGVEAWVPLALGPRNPGNSFLRLIGRMKPGVSVRQASDDLSAVTAAYNKANNLQRDIRIYPLHDFLASGNRRMLLVLQGTVAFVLLIACANVANLLLARSVSRGRELSIRAAIGAGRLRLVRQLLTESIVLSLAGGVVGVLLASWLLRLFLVLAPANFAGVQAIRMDLQVLLMTLAVAMATGVLFGLAPARHGFHVDPNDSLRDAGTRGATSGGAGGASRLLVVAEIALAMVLVSGAGLMVKSLMRLESQDPGFRPESVMTFQLTLPAAKYATPAAATQTIERMLSEVRSIPGVSAAGAINMIPLTNFGMNGPFSIVGQPPFQRDRAPVVEFRATTSEYFQVMGIPLKRGKAFTGQETATSAPVVIINQTMADQFWPKGNPIGERIQLGFDLVTVPREIIGVVGDARSQALSARPVPESYVPYSQAPFPGVGIVIRTQGADAASILPAVRRRMSAIDADLPLVRPQTMETVVAAAAGSQRLSSVLTAVFALLAGVLASLGIYSLIAYSVAERTRELGIRVALGADRGAVARLIVGEGLRLAGVGIAIGLAGSWMLTGTLQSMLYEVSPLDPGVLATTCGAVLMVTILASYVPARRALRVDPMTALRAE